MEFRDSTHGGTFSRMVVIGRIDHASHRGTMGGDTTEHMLNVAYRLHINEPPSWTPGTWFKMHQMFFQQA